MKIDDAIIQSISKILLEIIDDNLKENKTNLEQEFEEVLKTITFYLTLI